jgi:hypothetical protein
MFLSPFVHDFEGRFFDMFDAAHIGEGCRIERHATADRLAFEQAEQTFLRQRCWPLWRGFGDSQAEFGE